MGDDVKDSFIQVWLWVTFLISFHCLRVAQKIAFYVNNNINCHLIWTKRYFKGIHQSCFELTSFRNIANCPQCADFHSKRFCAFIGKTKTSTYIHRAISSKWAAGGGRHLVAVAYANRSFHFRHHILI